MREFIGKLTNEAIAGASETTMENVLNVQLVYFAYELNEPELGSLSNLFKEAVFIDRQS